MRKVTREKPALRESKGRRETEEGKETKERREIKETLAQEEKALLVDYSRVNTSSKTTCIVNSGLTCMSMFNSITRSGSVFNITNSTDVVGHDGNRYSFKQYNTIPIVEKLLAKDADGLF